MRKSVSFFTSLILTAALCSTAFASAEAPAIAAEGSDGVSIAAEEGSVPSLMAGVQDTSTIPEIESQPTVAERLGELGSGQGASADDSVQMKIASCEEQNFSTLCLTDYEYDYHPDQGLCIYTGGGKGIPFVLMFKTDATGFNAEGHFSQVFTPEMQQNYGDNLIDIGEFQTYTVSGIEMPGQMYTYLIDGIPVVLFRLFDIRDDHFVCYTVKYRQDDSEATLNALARAAYYYQPDAHYYDQYAGGNDTEGPENDKREEIPQDYDYQAVSCPEMGFSFLTEKDYTWNWDEGGGVTVYTKTENSVPYIMVYSTGDLFDPEEYISETFTRYMQEKYGSDLIGITEYEYYTVGGKDLPAAMYIYRTSEGYTLKFLRCVEVVDGHIVMYSAKMLNNDEEETLKALDLAVSSFQPDANYYN